MGFNSGFKGLNGDTVTLQSDCSCSWPLITRSQFNTSSFEVEAYAISRDCCCCCFFITDFFWLDDMSLCSPKPFSSSCMQRAPLLLIPSVGLQPLLGPGLSPRRRFHPSLSSARLAHRYPVVKFFTSQISLLTFEEVEGMK